MNLIEVIKNLPFDREMLHDLLDAILNVVEKHRGKSEEQKEVLQVTPTPAPVNSSKLPDEVIAETVAKCIQKQIDERQQELDFDDQLNADPLDFEEPEQKHPELEIIRSFDNAYVTIVPKRESAEPSKILDKQEQIAPVKRGKRISFDDLVKVAESITVSNMTTSDFRFMLSHRYGHIVPANGAWEQKLIKKLKYKFVPAIRDPYFVEQKTKDYQALISSGMRAQYAATLAKVSANAHTKQYMSKAEIAKRVALIYKDNKSLIDDYMTKYPGEFKLPEFMEEKPKEPEKDNPSVPNVFDRSFKSPAKSLFFGRETELQNAVNEIATNPNLSYSEFALELSRKMGVIIGYSTWCRLSKYIHYHFVKKIQRAADRQADFASLICCGMSSDAAMVISKTTPGVTNHIDNLPISDERVYRLYQENKEIIDDYAKRHQKFNLPDFSKFIADSHVFNKQAETKEEVVVEQEPVNVPVTSGRESFPEDPSPELVKKLCDTYTRIITTTTLSDEDAVRKTVKETGYNARVSTVKKYLFGHIYVDPKYASIPTPSFLEMKQTKIDPVTRRLVQVIKMFRKEGKKPVQIARIFKESRKHVSSEFVANVYYEIKYTQQFDVNDLTTSEAISIGTEYKKYLKKICIEKGLIA